MGLVGNFMGQVGNLIGHVENFMGQVGNPLGQNGKPMGQDENFVWHKFKIEDSDLLKCQQFFSVWCNTPKEIGP